MALEQDIINWLIQQSVNLNIEHVAGRKAFVFQAGVDELRDAITFEGSVGEFCRNLVRQCVHYGSLQDDRDSVGAVLQAVREQVGRDHREECDILWQRWAEQPTPGMSSAGEPPSSVAISALQNAYLARLLNVTSQLPLTGIDRNAASHSTASSEAPDTCLNLGAIYTALFTIAAEHGERGQDVERAFEEREHRLSALEQVNQHNRLVLLGDPGGGKSTFVKFVAMCLAGELLGEDCANLTLLTAPLPDDKGQAEEQPQPWTHGAMLPVLVILRDFAATGLPPQGERATADHLWNFIAAQLQTPFGDYAPYMQPQLLSQGGLILLDGLDEVPEADQRRTQITQAIEDFAATFRVCQIVVTSRTYAYQKQDWKLSGFREAVLAPFGDGQIRRFVDQWYRQMADVRGLNQENARGGSELLQQAIFRSSRLHEFAKRPLLLTLMASLHAWRSDSLPEKRAQLYAEATDLLLKWWEQAKIVKDARGARLVSQPCLTEMLKVGEEALQHALSDLAFHAHLNQADMTGTADITEAQLVQALWNIHENKDLRPGRLIEFLSERAGLLVSHGNKVYTFPHRTFQEYLAAWYLTEEETAAGEYPDNVAALVRREPNRWREVALLAAAKAASGSSRMIWLLVDALCECDPADEHVIVDDAWGALLSGQALVETAKLHNLSKSNQRRCDRVKTWLAAILTAQQPVDTPFPVIERALAGNILAQLGDSRPGVWSGVRCAQNFEVVDHLAVVTW